jgi:hypothetical protein
VAILSSSCGSSRLLCIEIPAALRHFQVDILIQIGVERNERLIEKSALEPDPRGVAAPEAAIGIEWNAELSFSMGTRNGEEWRFDTKSIVFRGIPSGFV